MNWNVRQAASALRLSEREVSRLAQRGELPSCRVNDEYLFNPVDLQEWAVRQGRRMDPDALTPAGTPGVALRPAIERGGIHYDLAGDTRSEVLDAVAALPGIPAHVDRGVLAQVLHGRERLASTGVGGGIAIPHPRDPLVLQVEHPIVLLSFLAREVDFKAIDGRPVRVLFTLLSPTIPLHLRMLSRLAYALHDAALSRLLAERAAREAILARVGALDGELVRAAAR